MRSSTSKRIPLVDEWHEKIGAPISWNVRLVRSLHVVRLGRVREEEGAKVILEIHKSKR